MNTMKIMKRHPLLNLQMTGTALYAMHQRVHFRRHRYNHGKHASLIILPSLPLLDYVSPASGEIKEGPSLHKREGKQFE